jgi:hypothetical protein
MKRLLLLTEQQIRLIDIALPNDINIVEANEEAEKYVAEERKRVAMEILSGFVVVAMDKNHAHYEEMKQKYLKESE